MCLYRKAIAQQDDSHQSQTTGTPLAKTDVSCRPYLHRLCHYYRIHVITRKEMYRSADKSLARPGMKQATATKL